MDHKRIEADLKFIKDTMEASTRYTNVPPMGHVVSGALGLAGPVATYAILGPAKVANSRLLTPADVSTLGSMWALILAFAAGISVILMVAAARREGTSAWKSPAALMFGSQVPLLLVAGTLTLGLYWHGAFKLIPALWLLSYGLMLFAFHYYTGRDHLQMAVIFLALGAGAAFAPGWLALALLGLGFGGVNLWFGVRGLL